MAAFKFFKILATIRPYGAITIVKITQGGKEYLEQMNANTDDKATMLKYIVGNTVLDVGVGGGVLGKLIRERKPHLKVIGRLDYMTLTF